MKKVFFIIAFLSVQILFDHVASAAEIVEVRIKIPMNNDESRIKDYYLSTEGTNLKKDLVVKILRNVSVTTVGKKNLGDLKIEIGQLRIIAVNDKIAIAREYKLHSKEIAPLTESIGFMIGDLVDTTDSFIDKNPRKPSSDEDVAKPNVNPTPRDVASVTPSVTAPIEPAAPAPEAVHGEPKHGHSGAQPEGDAIKVQIFPEAI